MTVQRFELSDGKSHKFWSVNVQGADVHIHWGRIGTQGQSKVKSLPSAAAASQEAQKLIASKTKKGYAPVTPHDDDAPAPVPAVPRSTPASPPPAVAAPPTAPPPERAAPAPAATIDWPDEETFVVPDAWSRKANPPKARTSTPAKVAKTWAALQARWASTELRFVKPMLLASLPALDQILQAPAAPAKADAHVDAHLGAVGLVITVHQPALGTDVVDFWLRHGPAHAVDALFACMPLVSSSIATKDRYPHLITPLADHLASLDDAAQKSLAASLEAHSQKSVDALVAATLLTPRPQPWSDALLQSPQHKTWREQHRDMTLDLLARSACRPADVAALLDVRHLWNVDWRPVFARGGRETLEAVLENPPLNRTVSIELLAAVPSDATARTLFARAQEGDRHAIGAFDDLMGRFPKRALRTCLPAVRAGDDFAERTARRLVLTWPGLEDQLGLDDEDRARIAALLPDDVPDAAPEDVPDILRHPPWMSRPPEPKAVKLDLTAPDLAPALTWTDDERSAIVAAGRAAGAEHTYGPLYKLAWGDDTLKKGNPPIDMWGGGAAAHLPRAIERHGLDVLHAVLAYSYVGPFLGAVLKWCTYIADPVLVPLAARKLRTKRDHKPAAAWLEQHPTFAARLLIPVALGKKTRKQERDDAMAALLHIMDNSGDDEVLAVARDYAPEAAAYLEARGAIAPVHRLPKKLPAPPDYLVLGALPRPVLHAGGALPEDAASNFLIMLALSTLDEPYPGLTEVVAACTPASQARFSWAVFEEWEAQGMPSQDSWLFEQLGHLADDGVVRRLSKKIREWPGEGGHARSVKGLDVLAAIGTDVALMNIYAMSLKLKFKGLKKTAGEKVAEIGEARGLTADEMADRLVPRFDLDDEGRMPLDYGPRSFTVGFDEQLKPFVLDQSGKRLKNLPKPGQKDDPDRAVPAEAKFKQLKKDVRDVAGQQLYRFEQIMVRQRRWSRADFQTFVVDHPLLVHLARRLVFGQFDAAGEIVNSFRVAEDRTFANVDDDELDLSDDHAVGLPHPLDFPAGADATWAAVFSDYGLIQPFTQLGRETFVLDDKRAKERAYAGLEATLVPTGKVLGLEKRGWQRGEPQDGGCIWWMKRALGDGRTAYLALDPGIVVGLPGEFPEQTLGKVTIEAARWGPSPEGEPFSTLTPVEYSELMLDLSTLTAG